MALSSKKDPKPAFGESEFTADFGTVLLTLRTFFPSGRMYISLSSFEEIGPETVADPRLVFVLGVLSKNDSSPAADGAALPELDLPGGLRSILFFCVTTQDDFLGLDKTKTSPPVLHGASQ
jgi:hypothetical protein